MDISGINPNLFRRQRALIAELVRHTKGEPHALLAGIDNLLSSIAGELAEETGENAYIHCNESDEEDDPRIIRLSRSACRQAHTWVTGSKFLHKHDNCPICH